MPQVAALFAFLQVVAHNVGSSSFGRWGPRQVDTLFKGSDNFWCGEWTRICCKADFQIYINASTECISNITNAHLCEQEAVEYTGCNNAMV